MELNKSDFIKSIGVGALLFLSIMEFSSLMEYMLEHLQISFSTKSFGLLWLPDLFGLIVFSGLLMWAFNVMDKFLEINLNRLLFILVFVFFGVVLLGLLYPLLGTNYVLANFTEEYSAYYKAKMEFTTQIIIGTSQVLKYLVFGFVLYFKM